MPGKEIRPAKALWPSWMVRFVPCLDDSRDSHRQEEERIPCPNCGAINPDGESRCFNCGAPITPGSVRYGRKIPVGEGEVKPAIFASPSAVQKSRKSRRTAIVLVVVGVVIGAAIGIYDIFYTLRDNPDLSGSVYFAYREADDTHDETYVHSWGTITNDGTSKTTCRVWIHLYDDMGHSKKKTVDLGSVGAGDSVTLSADVSWPYDYYDSWMYHIDGEVRLVY
ncbi:MAG: zinc ribbon domain-containing protein [Thermoplasmata archaeon]|jgi:hypothetical protein|nr:zinc ribbon domain-containing protein [Thermoplasmata archaeon]